jgi:serine/threonine protein kinase
MADAQGYAHCDLKPLNVVRVKAPRQIKEAASGEMSNWLLIDLDACSRIGEGFVGLKSSTAFVPPELLYYAEEAALTPLPSSDDTISTTQSSNITAATTSATTSSVPGGEGWHVRAVKEDGTPLDGTQSFTALKAHASFDMWSFGCVMIELLLRGGLWHADTDSNLRKPEDYRRLAEWSAADATREVNRVPDRWAQALLLRLLAPSPSARPSTFAAVLEHPFFTRDESFAVPPLTGGDKSHVFISHFQGAFMPPAGLSVCRRSVVH